MKGHQRLLSAIMTPVLGCVLCGFPECCRAQQDAAPQPTNQYPQKQGQDGTMIDPSKGPLEPVTVSDGASQTPAQSVPQSSTQALPTAPSPQPPPEEPVQEPVGSATAEGVPTVGGAASRPAGEAIAPAKQNQRRSLLLKMGMIAAVGVATGVVYALTKSSPSKP